MRSFFPDTRAVVLTISDRCFSGEQADRSGPAVVEMLKAAGVGEVAAETLPDEMDGIVRALEKYARAAELVVTTGGTGLAERDVTPEATKMVCERLVDGLADQMRATGQRHTPVCGTEPGGLRDGGADIDY